MRVAVYLGADYYSPLFGGALATWTHQVYRKLQEKFEISIFCQPSSCEYADLFRVHCRQPFLEKWVELKLRNRSFRGFLDGTKQYLRTSLARVAAESIALHGADIVHIHNDPEAVVAIRRKLRNARIVLHMNNNHLIEVASARLASNIVDESDRIVFCSEYLKRCAEKALPTGKISKSLVIYNGCLIEDRFMSSATKGFKGSHPVILFVGRLVPEKGAHVLLESFRRVVESFPTAELRIVGGSRLGHNLDNDYTVELRRIAADLGGSVNFIGPVEHDKVSYFMRSADIFVCSSIWDEPLGMVNLEAMAVGTPVIAFARGGIPETIGDCGLLLNEADASLLSDSILRLLRDQDLRDRCSVLGRLRAVEFFDWSVIAAQWDRLLTELV